MWLTKPSDASLLGDTANDLRCGVQRVVLDACGESQMHDQDVRSLCEVNKLRVSLRLV
jgi:hypothetical protein